MAWVCDHEPDVANAMAEKTSYLTELIIYKDSPWGVCHYRSLPMATSSISCTGSGCVGRALGWHG